MTSVWAASSDLVAGQTLTADDLEATRVRFDEAADHDRYLGVDDELPAALTLTRPLSAGELVPAAALGEQAADDTVSLSIAVAAEHVPTDLVRGSRVDVWVVGDRTVAQRRGGAAAELVLGDVAVLDAPVVSDAFASATSRQLVLAVPAGRRGVSSARSWRPSATTGSGSSAGGDGVICVLLLAAGEAWESPALTDLEAHPGVVVLKRCVDVDDLLAAVTSGQADVAVVSLDAPGLDPASVAHLRRHAVRPVAVTVGARPRTSTSASTPQRLGITALVGPGELASLPRVVTTVEDVADTRARDDVPVHDLEVDHVPAAEPGRLVAVWGPAGAPGRTTVATNLAWELARRDVGGGARRPRPLRRCRRPAARHPRRGVRPAVGLPPRGRRPARRPLRLGLPGRRGPPGRGHRPAARRPVARGARGTGRPAARAGARPTVRSWSTPGSAWRTTPAPTSAAVPVATP